MADKALKPGVKRVFINDADKYSSKNIARFLSECLTLESSEDSESSSPRRDPAFYVVGTVTRRLTKDKCLQQQYVSPSRPQLLEHLMECDVVIYNISENSSLNQVDEATWALTSLHADMEKFKTKKMFILVSTVMTWAMTKPQNPDDSDVQLSEEEFRRRRPHPSFRSHNNLEKLVIKLCKGKKAKLSGYVVNSGLQYGQEQNLFHYFFKVSWLMKYPKVPIFGDGSNYIPMIHVFDLGGVIQKLIEVKPKSKYIVAVDDSKNTLEEIVKMISDTLGPGKTEIFAAKQAITMEALKLKELECLLINLRLDPIAIKDTLSFRWTSELGMIVSIEKVVEEFKNTRQLLPIRIAVLGPPCVGKTTVAEKLCKHYKIHRIQLKDMIDERMKQLKEIVDAEDSGDESSEDMAAVAAAQLDTFQQSMDMNEGRLSDYLLHELLQERLNSKPCLNQGFVLDGYPKTYEQATLIFQEEVTESEEGVAHMAPYNLKIIPEFVFEMEAPDFFLLKRVEDLPPSVKQSARYIHHQYPTRLRRYRDLFTEEETVLDYFDEREIHPETIPITDDPEYKDVVEKILEAVGNPKNYGPTAEERALAEKSRGEKTRQSEEEYLLAKKSKNEVALAEMAVQYLEWQKNASEVKRQEQELEEAQALPLRNYVIKYVAPALGEAMLACCKIKPEDPVEFLAEHLLRNNQE